MNEPSPRLHTPMKTKRSLYLPSPNMASSSPATSFMPFPRLPIELRLKIWSFALISYPVQTFRLKTRKILKPRKHHTTTIRATAPQPALAHANQEARLEALEHFSQIPTTRVSNTSSAQNYPPDHKCALVNFSIDVFTVERIGDIPFNPSESLKQIQLLRAVVKHLLFFSLDLENSYLSRVDALREVEFIVLQGQDSIEYLEEGVERMVDSFDEVRKKNPNWIFPKVKIVEDGVVLRVYEGGAWTGEV
ncbi:hypothetical protein BKA61DRAFT_611773 [Leptodontidium sp. MPI-SDFR-AT-0119]|nr:hypothetical protein BKA61DRAFT_611773 [Leptodontidium sp. MPI-SDFR-AT-0119]